MALQFTVDILPDNQADKLTVVKTAVVALPTPNQLIIAIGDDVSKDRQVEILNAWKYLYNGVRDRALLDDQFAGAVIISSTDINKIGEFDRRTTIDLSVTTATDVTIGIGSGMMNGLGRNALVMIDTGFEILRGFALENELKGIPAVPAYAVPAGTITKALGTWSIPAEIQLTGKLWKKGTTILVAGTADVPYTTGTITIPKDMFVREVAFHLSNYLKGWNQVTFDSIPNPTDDSIVAIRGLASFGGIAFEFTTLTIVAA